MPTLNALYFNLIIEFFCYTLKEQFNKYFFYVGWRYLILPSLYEAYKHFL